MIDLIYDGALLPIIREKFPDVIVRDASDDVHEDRIEVELPDDSEHEYIKHLIRQGCTGVSLHVQLLILRDDEKKLRKALDELNVERGAPREGTGK